MRRRQAVAPGVGWSYWSARATAGGGSGFAEEDGRGFAEGFVVGVLLGEVGGGFEGGEGLEVGLGLDHGLTRGVDGLDRFDRGLVVGGLGDFAELGEGEAVDLADEDGGHRGIEEVFEEGFGERGTGHLGLATGGRGRVGKTPSVTS